MNASEVLLLCCFPGAQAELGLFCISLYGMLYHGPHSALVSRLSSLISVLDVMIPRDLHLFESQAEDTSCILTTAFLQARNKLNEVLCRARTLLKPYLAFVALLQHLLLVLLQESLDVRQK